MLGLETVIASALAPTDSENQILKGKKCDQKLKGKEKEEEEG